MMTPEELYNKMKECNSCKMRKECTQVVTYDGSLSPILMICGEAPGADEDREGVPFCGDCGQILRTILRETKILNKTNTIISNVLKCRPPGNKFPTDECPSICSSLWLKKEIEILNPKRLLLVGSVALKYVAGLKDGISKVRGNWLLINGIRTISTFHPSYVMRKERSGSISERKALESDIYEVSQEVSKIQEGKGF